MIKKLRASKKADDTDIPIFSRKMVYYMVLIILLGIYLTIFLTVTTGYIYKITETPKALQCELYVSRFFNYAGCFAYEDPNILRTYQDTVDVNKFTSAQL